jgi:hypothetical protein
MTENAMQALCCECGQIRTYKRARNYVGECYGDLSGWARMIGELKCANCGAITRHALLRSADDFRDYAEQYSRVALGGQTGPDDFTDVERARREYRIGLPRNPYLHHMFWVKDAEKAQDAGQSHVATLCGGRMLLPAGYRYTGSAAGEYFKPQDLRDQEYEDPDTGHWWVEMDCVDCLRVYNEDRLARRRAHLLRKLKQLALNLNSLDAAVVEALISNVEVMG